MGLLMQTTFVLSNHRAQFLVRRLGALNNDTTLVRGFSALGIELELVPTDDDHFPCHPQVPWRVVALTWFGDRR